ncbi:hypothetical protein [uncultured Bacteroides sp.]|nr:hypothetical protein [uncultured Bacteroides sp.]
MKQLTKELTQEEKMTIYGGAYKWVLVNGEWIIVRTLDSSASINLPITE